jgi:Sugar (and other) transporter
LMAGIKLLTDSPRYLAYVGRLDEAKEVLEHIRGSKGIPVQKEFLEICAVAEDSKPSSPIQFAKVLGHANNRSHLGRCACLCLWLQIMASWTSITAATAYSPSEASWI